MVVVIYLTVLFFAVLGLCDFIHSVKLWFIGDAGNRIKLFCVISDDEQERGLRYAIEQLRWHGTKYTGNIIAVTLTHDEALLERCHRLGDPFGVQFVCADKSVAQIICGDFDANK